MMFIEVAYARVDKQFLIALEVPEKTKLIDAIKRSGILEECPELSHLEGRVGVFSEPRALDAVLEEGDRVEIYRELPNNPMETRRRRARDQEITSKR